MDLRNRDSLGTGGTKLGRYLPSGKLAKCWALDQSGNEGSSYAGDGASFAMTYENELANSLYRGLQLYSA